MPRDWTRQENEATVANYLDMLRAELRNEPYVKVEHYRALQPLVDGRSVKAIEWKQRNVAAILLDLGYHYIPGLTPATNYQQDLADVVAERLAADEELRRAIEADATRVPPLPDVEDVLSTLEDPPPPRERSSWTYEGARASGARRPVDYLEIEARNADLGLVGEQYALTFERARLTVAGKPQLADRIEHTSVEQGDGAGFDIRSYETDGTDRFIEVKTTKGGIYTPLYLSRNELYVSREKNERYHLYRAFDFRRSPRMFTLAGRLDRTLRLEPTTYVGRVL